MDGPQLISRREALACGMSDTDLRRLCHSGVWLRVRAGQYLRSPQSELTPAGRHLMLALATGEAMSDAAVASHCSAVVIHGAPTWALPLDRVHMTRDRINGGRKGKQLVVHSAQIEPDEITMVNGIRVTTPARTVIDIARSEGFELSVVIADAFLRQGLTTADELRAHLLRARYRPGCRKAAQVVGFADGRSESVGESRSRIVIRRGGLPAAELQARVFTDDGICVGRVDFLFAELGVVGEFDGKVKYQSELRGARESEQVVVAEKIREDKLRALGWMVVRWTWNDLDHPDELIRRIRAAAAAAACARRIGCWTPTPAI
ncbi:type IV toxin-antitoxin system AbiEi family antitoxin domain-containing protein [Nocardia sp. NPDC051756]|uniref:type IV toxin-antitoxin system AbiEi family antitoxin domain-containing protein n=1 Tax=Nocardia sp. NPDC051756 TaxID=3154751 RepID=UPI00341E6D18